MQLLLKFSFIGVLFYPSFCLFRWLDTFVAYVVICAPGNFMQLYVLEFLIAENYGEIPQQN